MNRVTLLFLVPTLIWGSTWIVITFQLGPTPPEISVFYRFVLTTVLALGLCFFKKETLRFSRSHHLTFFFQGLCMFCMNYILTYHAERFLVSGLVAVLFTMLIYVNMFGARFFLNQRASKRTVLGSLVGALGVFFIFHDEILTFKASKNELLGIGLALFAVGFSSVGNLISARYKEKKIPILPSMTWALVYGSLLTSALCLSKGLSFQIPLTWEYLGALSYLSVFGTIIAFYMYIELIHRIGMVKAAYVTVTTPVIALLLSYFFENLQLNFLMLLGIALCFLGQLLVLTTQRERARP